MFRISLKFDIKKKNKKKTFFFKISKVGVA